MRGETAPELVAVLEDAQRLGFLGPRPIPEVVEHARGFVRAIEHRASIGSVLDLGSGGGVPGLVIAHDLSATHVTLLDRRTKRTDALERYVRRLGWQARVSVVCEDVGTFGPNALFDAVVARGFGPPAFTLSSAARLVQPGGAIVISEPPAGHRWDDELLERLGLRQERPSDLAATTPTAIPATTADPAALPGLDGLVAVFLRN